MLALISPAKTLDYDSKLPTLNHSQARLLEQSQQLIDVCRTLSSQNLMDLMSVSQKIADVNVQHFQDWHSDMAMPEARQAIFAFKGDVYTGLDAYTLNESQLAFAQQHLRCLSGLYGLLRPLDLMLPYRLEMGTKLKNPFGQNLYEFWGQQITDVINQDLAEINANYLINLASDEYYKSVKESKINAKIIKVTFLDQKNGKYKIISFYAKKARGLMARHMIEQNTTHLDDLRQFKAEGYYFDEINSNQQELVFKRDEIVDND